MCALGSDMYTPVRPQRQGSWPRTEWRRAALATGRRVGGCAATGPPRTRCDRLSRARCNRLCWAARWR